MRQKISILTGSGFSIPEGLPDVGTLNKRLSKIDESEILIHTDQTAMFLEGREDSNRWSRWDERVFLQEFLEFYNSEIIKSQSEFHYETFYDFYSGYLFKNENKEVIEEFYNSFNKKHLKDQGHPTNCYNRISDFNRSYNQLLASELYKSKYFEDISTLNYPPYDSFIGFLIELLKSFDIKFHTLNHDLFFDWLGKSHADLWQHFTDGYQLEGSPFYGTVSYEFNHNKQNKVRKTYYVKLEQFVNKFDKPLAYFKLHGSVFNTIVFSPAPNSQKVRLKDNYGIHQFFMEVVDSKTGEMKFEHLWDEAAPDFLSGTTNKTRYYSGDSYYNALFQHFEKNLSSSDYLIVVGYGFKDGGINEYIEKFFLSKGKLMYVIDPVKPITDFFEKYKAVHIPKGVTQVTNTEFVNLKSSLLKE